MTNLNPYISFNGACREAMNFYKKCFGGELSFQTFGETPMSDESKPKMNEKIIHSMLKSEHFVLMGTDMTEPSGFKPGNDISLSLNFDEENEIKKYFEMLSEKGEIIENLDISFWGDLFGVVRDQFGKAWMMNCPIKK